MVLNCSLEKTNLTLGRYNRITDSCYVDLGYEDTPVVPKEGMKKEGIKVEGMKEE